jgi:L-lysine 6-transaminase
MYTVQFADFVDKFVETLPEAFRSHVFFVAGGALAVENALKTAFDWKVRKSIAKGVGEKGTKIIHFKEAFHVSIEFVVIEMEK